MKATLFESPQPKEKGGWGAGGGLHEDRAKETSSGLKNHLELRLGISLDDGDGSDDTVATTTSDGKSRGGSGTSCLASPPDRLHLRAAKTWPPQSHTGFIHPWSLAARQQKAVLEQARHNSIPPPPPPSTIPRAIDQPSFPPVVGWPPICAFRRNLVDPQSLKSEMDGEKDAIRVKPVEAEAKIKGLEVKPTMFVKVNMEGYFVGRKIDLNAHDSYESLFQALKKMFRNFLSTNDSNNSNEQEQDEVASSDFILIYEDHEGDRMLVGDVPWKLFLASVKRLYIAYNPNVPNKVDGE